MTTSDAERPALPDLKEKLNIGEKEVEECYKAFCDVDPKNTGYINMTNVKLAIEALGGSVKDEDLQRTFDRIDKNHDDSVSFEEFAAVFARYEADAELFAKHEALKARLKIGDQEIEFCYKCFCSVDVNHIGYIGVQDLKKLIEALGGHIEDNELKKTCDILDKNHDDRISFEEFADVFGGCKGTSLERTIAKLSNTMQENMQNWRLTPREVALEHGMKQSELIAYIEKEITESDSCLQLPWTILLLATITMAFVAHWNPSARYGIEASIEFDIRENANFAFSGNMPAESGRIGHKNINDVNNYADFYSWFNVGFAPLIWRDWLPLSEVRDNLYATCLFNNISNSDCVDRPRDLLQNEKNDYLINSRLISGVRLQQEYDEAIPCEASFRFGRIGLCPSATSPEYWGHAHPIPEEQFSKKFGAKYKTHFFPNLVKSDIILHQSKVLEEKDWISHSTRKLSLSFATYHPEKGFITTTYINFFFSFGGRIWKTMTLRSHPVQPFTTWAIIFDIFWLLQIARILAYEIRDIIYYAMHSSTPLAGLRSYISFWNCVDWVSCCFAVYVSYAVWIWCSLIFDVREHLKGADPDLSGTWEADTDRFKFFDMMDTLALKEVNARYALTAYVTIMGLRFFKAFSGQPRLNLVAKTMSCALVDLAHFGVVFTSVFFIFCSAGVMLFGQDIAGFSSMGRAMTSCWRMLLGDYDIGPGGTNAWESMVEAGRWQAVVWFVGFACVVALLLFNMLLAIIMDVYTEVKGSISSRSTTLWGQCFEILVRMQAKRRGEFIALSDVLIKLDPTIDDSKEEESNDPILNMDELKSRVPNLRNEQAEEILVGASEFKASLSCTGASLSDAMTKVESLQGICLDLHEKVEGLIQLTTMITKAQMGEMKQTRNILEHNQQSPGSFPVLQAQPPSEIQPNPPQVQPPIALPSSSGESGVQRSQEGANQSQSTTASTSENVKTADKLKSSYGSRLVTNQIAVPSEFETEMLRRMRGIEMSINSLATSQGHALGSSTPKANGATIPNCNPFCNGLVPRNTPSTVYPAQPQGVEADFERSMNSCCDKFASTIRQEHAELMQRLTFVVDDAIDRTVARACAQLREPLLAPSSTQVVTAPAGRIDPATDAVTLRATGLDGSAPDMSKAGDQLQKRGTGHMEFVLSPEFSENHDDLASLGEDDLKDEVRVLVDDENGIKHACLINPNSSRRVAWEVFGMFVLIFDLIVLPLQLSFGINETTPFQVVSVTLLTYWIVDLISSFFVGFYDPAGKLVMHNYEIAIHYLTGWFIIDTLIIGADLLSLFNRLFSSDSNQSSSSMRVLKFLRIIRMMRLAKLEKLMESLHDLINSEYVTIMVSIVKALLFIIMANHYVACIWYRIGTDGTSPTWTQRYLEPDDGKAYAYACAFHWSVTQFTPASVDIQPQNTVERFFAICVLLVALVVFSAFVSNITSSVTALRSIGSAKERNRWMLRRYLREQNVSKNLHARVYMFISQVLDEQERNVQHSDVVLLANLSEPLRVELFLELHAPRLVIHTFFNTLKDKSPVALRRVCCQAVTSMQSAPGDVLFSLGEECKTMYILERGLLSYNLGGDSVNQQVVRENNFCSEAVLWTKWLHRGTMQAQRIVAICLVNAKEFRQDVVRYPIAAVMAKQTGSQFVSNLNSSEAYRTDLAVPETKPDLSGR